MAMKKVSMEEFFENAYLLKTSTDGRGNLVLPEISGNSGTMFVFRNDNFPEYEIIYNDTRFAIYNSWTLHSYDFYVCKGVEGSFADYPEQDIDEIPPQDSIFDVSAQREEFIDWLLLHGF